MLETMLTGGNGKYLPWSGPGNKKLLLGDRDLGYFGPVTFGELFTFDLPRSFINGITSALMVNASDQRWHKFIYKDRVLFIPTRCINGYQAWNTLYTSGLMYGMRGAGPEPLSPAAPATDQLIRLLVPETINGVNRDWVVKLQSIQGSTEDPVTTFVPGNTEFDDLFLGLFNGKWASLAIEPGRYYQTQTRLAGKPGLTLARQSDPAATTSTDCSSTIATYGWLPVVELVRGQNILTAPRRVEAITELLPTPVLKDVYFDGAPVLAPKIMNWSRDTIPAPLVSFSALYPQVTWTVSGGEGLQVTIETSHVVQGVRIAQGQSSTLPEPTVSPSSAPAALNWTVSASEAVPVTLTFAHLVSGVRVAYGDTETLRPVQLTLTSVTDSETP